MTLQSCLKGGINVKEKSEKQVALEAMEQVFDHLSYEDQKRIADLAMGMLLMQKLQSEKEADKSA